MTLAERTGPGLILPCLQGQDAAGVLQELSRAMQHAGLLPDLLRFYHFALNQELMVSSEVAAGIAFPHAPGVGIRDVTFALGRCDPPIAWGTNTTRAVRLVFLIAVPEGDSLQYPNVASGLSRLATTPARVQRLVDAASLEEILGVLGEVSLQDLVRPGDRRRNGA